MKLLFTSILIIYSMLNTFVSLTAYAQNLETPLEKCNYETVTSHSEMMSYLGKIIKVDTTMKMDIIGKSVQGRPIPLIYRRSLAGEKSIKVLIFCQQHGNEPSGKEAVLELIKELANEKGSYTLPNIDLYIIPSLNPDGNESAKRFNANGSDLNRNHLLLSEPEVVALHKIFYSIKPEVTLDVHEYSAFRRSFREAGYVRRVDEQFGAPTNLNISEKIKDYSFKTLFPFLDNYLNERGVTFSNYFKMNDPIDTVRASTTGITDGRQSFAIFNNFSFILEGKNGLKFNEGLKRRTKGQLEALKGFLKFIDSNSVSIKSLVKSEQEKLISLTDSVIVQMDYYYDGSTIDLPMSVLKSNADTVITMPYSPQIIKLKSVSRPLAYLIPQKNKEIIDFLDRHNIEYKKVINAYNQSVEIYIVKNVEMRWLENKLFKIVDVSTRVEEVKIETGDIVISTNQIANNLICIALEPESMWGLSQYDEFLNYFKKGSDYPIFRVLTQ